jgi:hypothetical protein
VPRWFGSRGSARVGWHAGTGLGVWRVWCVGRVGYQGRGDQQYARPDHGGYLTAVGVFSCVGVGVVVSMAVRVDG